VLADIILSLIIALLRGSGASMSVSLKLISFSNSVWISPRFSLYLFYEPSIDILLRTGEAISFRFTGDGFLESDCRPILLNSVEDMPGAIV